MSKENKYIFIVRQKSISEGGGVFVDSLYNFDDSNISDSVRTLEHMQLRCRLNSDCFPHVIMFGCRDMEFTFESLDEYLNSMDSEDLSKFLETNSIKP